MAKPIEDIRKKSDEPNNKVAIWEALKALALSDNPPTPIIGYADNGIQYRGKEFDASGTYDIYTKSALNGHIDRKRYS